MILWTGRNGEGLKCRHGNRLAGSLGGAPQHTATTRLALNSGASSRPSAIAGGQHGSDDDLLYSGPVSWGQREFDLLRADRVQPLRGLRGAARSIRAYTLRSLADDESLLAAAFDVFLIAMVMVTLYIGWLFVCALD